jgi:hypothetical protein
VFDGSTFLLVYGLGVAVGLALTDAPPAIRLGLALLWPVGPAAFLVTLGLLAAIVFAAAAAWWWMSSG